MSSNAEVGTASTSYDSNTMGRRRSTGKSPVTENDALSEMTKKVSAKNVCLVHSLANDWPNANVDPSL